VEYRGGDPGLHWPKGVIMAPMPPFRGKVASKKEAQKQQKKKKKFS